MRTIIQSTHRVMQFLFASLLLTTALPIMALDMTDSPYRLDVRFIDFSLLDYLTEYHPEWLPQASIIDHWSGVHSVNPLALLVAIEQSNRSSVRSGHGVQSAAAHQQWIDEIEALAIDLSQQSRTQRSTETMSAISAFDRRLDELMRQADRPARTSNINDKPPFSLPTKRFQNWQFGGVHSNNGLNDGSTLSAIDLAGNWAQFWLQNVSEYKVAAAHDGVASVFSQCFVLITHSSGWMTGYYHLDNISVETGQIVRAGQIIAEYANNRPVALCNGGQSSSPHLHFSLRFDGVHMPLQDQVFSGYRVHSGAFDYDINPNLMYLEKNGIRHYAFRQFVFNDVAATAIPIDFRFNGMWYQPDYAGHGINLVIDNVSDSNTRNVFVTLFTYDDEGLANFYTGNIGTTDWVTGEPLEIPMLQTSNGGFSQLTAIDFQTDAESAGHLTLTLEDCQNGRLSYQLRERSNGSMVSQAYELSKLIGVPQSECPLTSE